MKIVMAAGMALLVLAGTDRALAQTADQRVNTALDRARDAGVPVSLLESKIAEGHAKGVPMDRIAAAVERREAALERASQALRGRSQVEAADLAVGADAMESGVSEAALRAVADAAPKERRVVAIAVLTQLVQMGRAPQAALDAVKDALKRGPDALTNLPAQAAAAHQRDQNRDHMPPGHDPEHRGGQSGQGGGQGGHGGPPNGVPAPGKQPHDPPHTGAPGSGGGQGKGPSTGHGPGPSHP